ncbi:MAG: pseudouridine synthase [Parcubacteria group bacterium]
MEKIVYPIRINRYLAMNNYCSRREADDLILKKIVKINGRLAKIGDKVQEGDKVEVNIEAKSKLKKYVYFAYNKPIGIVTHTPEAGQTEIKKIAGLSADIFPVGRLDKKSHGLIILTNDGRITDKLLNPEYEHEKEYSVKTNKPVTNIFVKVAAGGMQLEDFKTKPCRVKKIGENSFSIILTEGKKHQIRRMCTNFGFEAVDLKRVRIMNIKLGSLLAGQKREIKGDELKEFLNKLGI